MAANESSGPASAPSPAASQSSQNSATPNLKAKKDRTCPFCHQSFTSSSLGRHLDLYIKERNPKPPDGVHNVDQIKQMRAGITRRQTKQSHAKRASSPGVNSSRSPGGSTPPHVSQSPIGVQPQVLPQSRLPVNWLATGVINNLPPRPVSSSVGSRVTPSTLNDINATSDAQQQWQEDKDAAKAAEMALKEVLGSIQAASARIQRPSIFEFDPLTLNFAALCLRVLPAPKTLFSSTPLATSSSWPLSVPDKSTYEALHRAISERVCHWRQDRKLADIISTDYADGMNGVTGLGHPIEPESQLLFDHLQSAWVHWQDLSENAKFESWQLEILRAYSDERSRRQDSDKQVIKLQLELEQLRSQSEAVMNNLPGQPYRITSSPASQRLQHPGVRSPVVSPDIVKELHRWDTDHTRFDFDTIMKRWKDTIQNTRRGVLGHSSIYLGYTSSGNGTTSNRIASPTTNGEQRILPPASATATPRHTPSDLKSPENHRASNQGSWTSNEAKTTGSSTPQSANASWEAAAQQKQQTQASRQLSEVGRFEEGKGPRKHIYPPFALPQVRSEDFEAGGDSDVVVDAIHGRNESHKRKRNIADSG